ncbi:hypothetical protein I3842_13G141900 [Carya illinoinensis]|uniref:Uncharacterized protein n=1 Tax=Carya illinoinensis TaxID=32201 RepID=A0A922AML7_CARIL|nr:hypothetical protein I3842_13G141900 [Carya illinoinensis]
MLPLQPKFKYSQQRGHQSKQRTERRSPYLYPHEDALVVTLLVANYTTKRILVDNESLTDVLSWDAFTKMGIDPSQLRPSPTLLKGFSSDAIPHVGVITLPMSVRKGPYTTTTMTEFLVIKGPSSYNAILGHPTLNHLKAITSTYHLKSS